MSLSKLLEKAKDFNLPIEIIEKKEAGRLEFISKFPLENIGKLTVDEYVQGTDENSFCYWLEFKNILFGVGGGNAAKYGLYKASDGNYYSDYGKNKKSLTTSQIKDKFERIKESIITALEFCKEDNISEINSMKIQMWNMILQKILSIYFPDKFLTIGAANVLIACAKDINIEGIDLIPQNSILINYLCKTRLSEQQVFSNWHYEKLGSYIWGNYKKYFERNYYIIGSKFGENSDKDIFPKMLEQSIVCTDHSPNLDLTKYYGQNHKEITDYLKQQGVNSNSCYALKYFLNLKIGDRIAIKASGSPKGNKGFLSIIGIAEVIKKGGKIYEYDRRRLMHRINVKFLQAPVYQEFEIGGYGRTIHNVNKTEIIEQIFNSEYDEISLNDFENTPTDARVIYAYLKNGLSHRDIQEVILGKEAPTNGGGFLAMDILHKYEIDGAKKGILIDTPFDIEKKGASGKYLQGLNLLEKHYTEFKSENPTQNKMKLPLNTILYGPPGTGKTYNTILKAAQIIEKRSIDDYSEAHKIFTENLGDRIEFITFHQNYSYEDFIQGLRPDIENDSLLMFERKDGIFKRISDRALENLKLSEKAPEEISKEFLFKEALENFIDIIHDNEGNFNINETAYIMEVEEDAFRYTGKEWLKHANGLRMKFTDLREFFINDVSERKDVKNLKNISGLAKQHATYYYLVYQNIIKNIPKKKEEPKKIQRENYVIIIDEINRANISRVFGELITLIETDKRSHGKIPLKATLPSGEEFIVPSNLYIIGTMNTADKSIALLDIALRRRFEFEAMYPKYEIEGYEIYDVGILEKINKKIIELKGYDFQIGHAYFMGENKDLKERMNKKVIPLLLEYFMNDEKEVKNILNSAGLEIETNSWPLRINGKHD